MSIYVSMTLTSHSTSFISCAEDNTLTTFPALWHVYFLSIASFPASFSIEIYDLGSFVFVSPHVSFSCRLYWITKRAGERQGSGLMKANAWHHRADAISSVVALIGVGKKILFM